ncbi:MAG: hypothetical protein KDB35_02630, partial [Acidimicrobiales bacterium]|nr:hypothetical protein [Acidimicrobiales bacterium]
IGWIPYFLERADYVYKHHRAWTGSDFGDRLPSEVFMDRVITCFIDDRFGLKNRQDIGVEHICWECDYPHSDSTWPRSPELLAATLEGIPDDEVDAMTHGNAIREFHYDPFAHRPRERCTVGALRAEAAGVDVSERSSGKAVVAPEAPITIASIIEAAAGASGNR